MNEKILLVEDDPNLGMVLQESLIHKGKYKVVLARDGQEGLRQFNTGNFDLCILDVMMPKMDGFTMAREIRKENPRLPIIFATAKSMLEDKVEGFRLGGDDYITKPFNIEELLLRIEALLRRSRGESEEEKTSFSIGKYTFDYTYQKLIYEGSETRITGKEAELLRLLCIHVNDVLLREDALLKIWKDDSYFNGRSMDVFLSKLRKHLKDDPDIEILNIHGKGYKLIVRNHA